MKLDDVGEERPSVRMELVGEIRRLSVIRIWTLKGEGSLVKRGSSVKRWLSRNRMACR